jgi:hypothetical protein
MEDPKGAAAHTLKALKKSEGKGAYGSLDQLESRRL